MPFERSMPEMAGGEGGRGGRGGGLGGLGDGGGGERGAGFRAQALGQAARPEAFRITSAQSFSWMGRLLEHWPGSAAKGMWRWYRGGRTERRGPQVLFQSGV